MPSLARPRLQGVGFRYHVSVLEILYFILLIAAVAAGILGVATVVRRFGGVRHRMTRPELRNRALEESRSLFQFVEEREAARPEHDSIIKDHEHPHRRVTIHDEETQGIYFKEHLPLVADLRELFAKRQVKSRALDDLYESVENDADIRTVSTALAEMAERLG